jgi:integrase
VAPIKGKVIMAILDNHIAIEDYRGLFIKNTVNLDAKKLSKKNYAKFNRESTLSFAARVKVNKKEYRFKLCEYSLLGKTVKTIIAKAALEREARIDEIRGGKHIGHSRMTLNDLWQEYSQFLVLTHPKKEKYVSNNTYFYNKHLKPAMGSVKIDDITTKMLQNIIHSMVNKPYKVVNNKKYYYAPSTVAQIKKVFGPMFHYAVDPTRRYLTESPMDGVVIPTFDNTRDLKLTEEKALALYETLMNYPDPKFRGIFMFMLEGRRIGEIFGLTWDRVDLETGEYYLPYDAHKGKTNLTFILSAHLLLLLKDLPGPREGYVFKSDRPSKENNGKPGGKITNINKRWKGILAHLGIEDMTRHDVRHWIGNTLVNTGKTTTEVARVLGHGDERVARRYAKTKERAARSAVDFFHEVHKKS